MSACTWWSPGAPVARQQPWVFQRSDSTRGEMVDQVAQIRIYREAWKAAGRPGLKSHEEFMAEVFGGSR